MVRLSAWMHPPLRRCFGLFASSSDSPERSTAAVSASVAPCVVHIDGKRAFSCQMQVSNLAGKEVTTIEGLSSDSSHPVQKAWLAERVPQCGYVSPAKS
jgi:aerobic-type carbon monoxide dehydrogenase small subunit (CoxS/CutS family)